MGVQVYHGEECKGMVTANFYIDGKRVQASFCDGDISSSDVVYGVEKIEKNKYRILEIEQLHTSLDSLCGKNPPKIKIKKIKAKTKREALKAMIEFIVKPYVNPSEYSFPVNATRLREGLEKELLN